MWPGVMDQAQVRSASPAAVGAKALTLARLHAAGLPVPDFFVVSADGFATHLRAAGISWPQSADAGCLERLRHRIRTAPVAPSLASAVLDAYRRLCARTGRDHVAVRSSGGEEDSASASFAGQFTSVLGVAGDGPLLDAVRDCWASCLSEGSLGYRAERGAPLGGFPAFGVIVQVQVFPEKAGVLFTVHPLEADGGCVYLEANFGTGESVTAGLVTPDAVEVSRLDPDRVETRIATKRRMTAVSPDCGGSRVIDTDDVRVHAPVLTPGEASALARAGLEIEALLGSPQDIEWAIDAAEAWILQSRPIPSPRVV